MNIDREKIDFDVLFVGAGPASLAGAIRLITLANEKGLTPEVAVIEKGAEIGAHALSGAIMNPVALKELIPDYKEKNCPLEGVVRGDEFHYLTKEINRPLPLAPKYMRNHGHFIISLSKFTRWLGDQAEALGVNIFPGFAGKEVLFGKDGKRVIGVRTGDKGLDRDGNPKSNFEPGIDIISRVTIFGEGARGSLMADVAGKNEIWKDKMPQIFETGIKEVIQLPEDNYFKTAGANDIHTFGYPLWLDIAGGGFIYEMKESRASIGFITGLSYDDAMLDPYEEFLKFKSHPFVAHIIKGGKVLEQGARTVCTGGLYTVPELAVDGAMFIGGAASMQNTPALKGVHLAMKSGALAAEAAVNALKIKSYTKDTLALYTELFEKSWAYEEMYEGRNFAQAMNKKAPMKFIHLGAQYFTNGKGARDPLPIKDDSETLLPARENYQRTRVDKKDIDGELMVDKLTGVFLSKTIHREDQPSHIIVHDREICATKCYEQFKNPCTRFCPGNVYEMDYSGKAPRLKLNPANCLHCKTCDIKDPFKNITWTCPEGGEGPGYTIS